MRNKHSQRGLTLIELSFAVLSSASLLMGVGLFYRYVSQTLNYIETSKNQLLLRNEVLQKVDCPSTVTPLGGACDSVLNFNSNYVPLMSETATVVGSVIGGPVSANGFKIRASCRNNGQNFISYQIDTKLVHPSTNSLLKSSNDWSPASSIPMVCPARNIYYYDTFTSDMGSQAMRNVMNRAYFGPFVQPTSGESLVLNDAATRQRLCSLRGADIVDLFYPQTSTNCAGKESFYWDAGRKAFSSVPACSQPNHMVRLKCRRY